MMCVFTAIKKKGMLKGDEDKEQKSKNQDMNNKKKISSLNKLTINGYTLKCDECLSNNFKKCDKI